MSLHVWAIKRAPLVGRPSVLPFPSALPFVALTLPALQKSMARSCAAFKSNRFVSKMMPGPPVVNEWKNAGTGRGENRMRLQEQGKHSRLVLE